MKPSKPVGQAVLSKGSLFLALCAALISGPFLFKLAFGSPPPRLVASPGIISLGKIAEGSVSTQTVLLRNSGKTPVIVSRVKTSCGCTTASSVAPVAPGATVPLQVRFDAHGKTGRNQQFVWVFVQGEAEPITVALRAEIVQAFQTEPTVVSLSLLAGNTQTKTTFSLRSLDNKPLRVLGIQTEPGIKATDWKQTGNSAQVNLTVTAPPLPGDYQKTVTVLVDHPVQHRVVVPVRFSATGLYRLDKSAVNFGSVDAASTHVSQTVSITGANVRRFVLAPLPTGITASLRPVSDGRTFLSVQFKPKGGSHPLVTESVFVVTNNPHQPRIAVPVYAAVSPVTGAH